jgi:hypothetical protein
MSRYKLKIGRVLLNNNMITQEQLEECLAHQKKNGGLIGEILIQKKILSETDVDKHLIFQKEKICPIAS